MVHKLDAESRQVGLVVDNDRFVDERLAANPTTGSPKYVTVEAAVVPAARSNATVLFGIIRCTAADRGSLNANVDQPLLNAVVSVLVLVEPKMFPPLKFTEVASKQIAGPGWPGTCGEKSTLVTICGEASSRLNTTAKVGSHAPTRVVYFDVNGALGRWR